MPHILIKINSRITKLNLEDINLIEALDDYVKIHTPSGALLSLITMKEILAKLPPSFIRIHRSFIIPIQKVQSFNKTSITIMNTNIPIGITYKPAFFTLKSTLHRL